MRHVWNQTISNQSWNRLFIKYSHVDDVKFVPMQVNRMRDLVIDINHNQFYDRIQVQFDSMNASAGGQKLVVEAMFAIRAIFIAEHLLVDIFWLR